MFEYQGIEVHWLKHSGFKIKTKDAILYIDPYQITGEFERAQFLFVSHSHFDHLDESSIRKVAGKNTVVFCAKDCVDKIKSLSHSSCISSLLPGEEVFEASLKVKATPAYNLTKPFHPKEKGWLGFLIEVEGIRIYFAGDTDLLSELEEIKCDIGLFPVSGTYLMTAHEAAKLANKIQPKVVSIPMHWGTLVDDHNKKIGTLEDAQLFCELCEGPSQILSAESK
jgi:L-ascorbate metabolism protein UlaG (beta-lactamase superfamily)